MATHSAIVNCDPKRNLEEDQTTVVELTGTELTKLQALQALLTQEEQAETTNNQNIYQAKRQAVAAFKAANTIASLKAALVDLFRLQKLLDGLE